MKTKTKETIITIVCAIISITAFITFWWWGTTYTNVSKLMSTPGTVVAAIFEYTKGTVGKYSLIVHALSSLKRVLIGFVIGSFIGVSLGLLMGRFPVIKAAVNPIFRFIRPIPPIAWIPISIIWFGIGESAKIFLIILAAFANTTLNALKGSENVDKKLINAAQMLGASESQIFFTVIIPAAVPSIFAGLHVGISCSWASVVAAEMIKAENGLGWIIQAGMDNNNITQILVGIIVIGIGGFILTTIMRQIERVMCRWNKSEI